MNRFDKIYLVLVVVLAGSLFLLSRSVINIVDAQEAVGIVSRYDREVLRFKLDVNDFYTVSGDLGDVVIEVKDGKVRVADEISPKHYCQTQGWVQHTNTPIVCLPNGIKVELQNNSTTEEDIIIR